MPDSPSKTFLTTPSSFAVHPSEGGELVLTDPPLIRLRELKTATHTEKSPGIIPFSFYNNACRNSLGKIPAFAGMTYCNTLSELQAWRATASKRTWWMINNPTDLVVGTPTVASDSEQANHNVARFTHRPARRCSPVEGCPEGAGWSSSPDGPSKTPLTTPSSFAVHPSKGGELVLSDPPKEQNSKGVVPARNNHLRYPRYCRRGEPEASKRTWWVSDAPPICQQVLTCWRGAPQGRGGRACRMVRVTQFKRLGLVFITVQIQPLVIP